MKQRLKESLQRSFPDYESALIDFLEEKAIIKTTKANEILIQPGNYLKHTMLVLEGSIKIYRENEDGAEAFLYNILPGGACAMSMLCIANHKQSDILAKAEIDSTVLLIPIQYTDELVKNYPSWYLFVVGTYRQRFEELLEVFDSIIFKSMDQRLEYFLKKQMVGNSSNTIELTHQQIASDLSTSREVISRLLKKMEQQGKLKLNRKSIEWLNS